MMMKTPSNAQVLGADDDVGKYTAEAVKEVYKQK